MSLSCSSSLVEVSVGSLLLGTGEGDFIADEDEETAREQKGPRGEQGTPGRNKEYNLLARDAETKDFY